MSTIQAIKTGRIIKNIRLQRKLIKANASYALSEDYFGEQDAIYQVIERQYGWTSDDDQYFLNATVEETLDYMLKKIQSQLK
jgi:hypothetical protein